MAGYPPPAFGQFRYTGAAPGQSSVTPPAPPSYLVPQWRPTQWQPPANAGSFLITPESDEPAAKRHQVKMRVCKPICSRADARLEQDSNWTAFCDTLCDPAAFQRAGQAPLRHAGSSVAPQLPGL